MCLAVPALIVEVLPDQWAVVEVGGIRSRVSLSLVDDVTAGDYVIVHAGFALTRLDVGEAQKTLALFAEIASRLGDQTTAVPVALHS